MEFILIGGISFVLGHVVASKAYQRHLNGREFEAEVRKQLQTAFECGMMLAADITTIEGQEELAGVIRRSAKTVIATNDNRP